MNNTEQTRKAHRITAAADSIAMIQDLLAQMRQETQMIDNYRVKVVNYYMKRIEDAQTVEEPQEEEYPGTSTLISTIRVPSASPTEPVVTATEVKKRRGHKGKLSDEAVRQIRNGKDTITDLSARYDISQPMISAIRCGRAYKHVK